jgi:RimJ/RimL family protein N-acetyltransferase
VNDEIEFRPLSAAMDLDLVHGWMQQPHVAPWWGLAGERDITRDYLFARLRLKHRDCWIVSAGGRAAAYAETFIVLDDPLAARYDAQPGDRGFNLLIGPPELLGTGVSQRVVRRLLNVLLTQPQITRVVCEADARNQRLLSFCRALGCEHVATLDRRHPRGLLLGWSREP